MAPSVVVCITLLIGAVSVRGSLSPRDASWPYDITTPFCYRTPSPININSSAVRYITTSTPLQFVAGQVEPYVVVNTGHSIEVRVGAGVLAYSTGGVLGTGRYIFDVFTLYWAGTVDSVATNTIDGVGTPLHARAVLRNQKYTNKTAYLQRDGFVVIETNINVEGYAPNVLFEPFGNILAALRKPGCVNEAVTLPAFAWFDPFLLSQRYYAYPGSLIDPSTGTQYDCATIVLGPKSQAPYISIPQFAHFQAVENKYGYPITNTLSAYPTNGRPVTQVRGVFQNYIPVG